MRVVLVIGFQLNLPVRFLDRLGKDLRKVGESFASQIGRIFGLGCHESLSVRRIVSRDTSASRASPC